MNKIKWLSLSRLRPYQRLSLAFATMLLVTLLSASPSLTQQDSPERLKLIEKIEATATLDHQAKTINVDHAVEEHENEAKQAGLTIPEIRKVYKKKIASLSQPDPWKEFLSWIGPVGIVIGILGFLGGAIKKKAEQLSQGIVDNIYKRFSGTKLFRNFALRRYRTSLINKYQELKIPFRPNRPLKMAEVYVPLQLLEQGKPLDAKQTIQNFKRLMIVGQPGSGKTMLLKSLALNYASDNWDIPQQPVAIVLELNRLSDAKLTIEQQLVKALKRDDFPNGTNFIEQGLKQGMIMLLFDGLDEVNSTDRPSVIQRLKDFIGTYKQCRVAITCRTQVYKREFDANVDQTVEVVDFNDQQIRNFLRPWKQSMSPEKSVEQLLNTLQDRPRIMELARNPLMLTIIAYLYTDTNFVLPHSRAEFYQKATDILLETWDEARQTPNQYKGRDKKLVLRHLALYSQDQTKGEQKDRRHLTWSEVNDQVASFLPTVNLNVENHLEPILEEICERSGLLMKIDGGEGYQFTHLTLQEFLAATQLIDDAPGLIERFEQDPDVWRETVKLWCGLAGDSTRLIQSVYQKDRVTAFNCLADAQKIEPDLATEIIDHFKGWLGDNRPQDAGIDNTVSTDSAIKAFGAVAADKRPRGRDVFDFLGQALSQEYRSRGYAAKALAATNIPEAAQILASHYLTQTDIQPQLVRMGDLAVPKLEVIAENGHISAIQHLGEIGTPLASKALIPLLKNKREDVALHAAVQLASLLKKTDIREELATYSSAELQSSSQTWQGIWDPFDTVKNSSISVIAEQIVDQLDKGLQTQQLAQIDLPELYPRIVLPIVVLSDQTFHKISENWIDTAQALLENTEQGKQLERTSPKLIEDALNNQPQRPIWEVLLKTLPLKMQLDVLYRLSVNRSPTRNDWQNLNLTVTYDLRTSWHYQLVLAIVLLLSATAFYEAIPLSHSSGFVMRILSLSSFFTVPVFWLILWRGTEKPFEPSLFISLGLKGPISFFREYGRLLRNQIVWNGAQAIFDSIASSKNIRFALVVAGGASICMAIFDNYFLSEFFRYAFLLIMVNIFVVAIAGVAASIFASRADAPTFDGTTIDTLFIFIIIFFVVIFAISTSIFGIITAVIALAGIGIGLWIKQATKPGFSRYFVIFSAPFFLGIPYIALFSGLLLYRVTGFLWPIFGGIFLSIVGICILLFKRGLYKERLAQNPLKGILLSYDADAV